LNLLEAKNIHKVYTNGKRTLEVLKGVDLNIVKGDFIAIVGPSGAGKSTLLHILGGLDEPSEGKVIFEGQDLCKLDDFALCKIRNQKIGFVFQFYHLLSEFNVWENVLMPALISRGLFTTDHYLKVEVGELLGRVGLSQRLEHFPNQLSGGEKQRVAIARALINKPDLLLCDEPTGNLDSKTGEEIISLIRKIKSETNMTVIMVTHNLELAKIVAKVYHLKDGILVS